MPVTRTAKQKRQQKIDKAGEVALPRPKTQWATPRENMSRMNYGVRSKKDTIARRRSGIKPLGTVTVSAESSKSMKKDGTMGKGSGSALRVMSIDEMFSAMVKAGGVPGPGAGPAIGPAKKFPRKEKRTVQLKPVGTTPAGHAMRAISDEEASANIRAGKTRQGGYEKAMLAALKALTTGYGKVSGGGALKAPNRGQPRGRRAEAGVPFDLDLSVDDLARAMQAMPKPSGAPKPPKYLPGVSNPNSPMRKPMGIKKPGAAGSSSSSSGMSSKAVKPGKLKKMYPTITASMRPTSSEESSALDGGGATELSLSVKNVVHKSEGATTMSKTDFNDLFKAELGVAGDEVLVDCPHCEAPITKSDLAKAHGHKGKGKTTHLTGAKHGKSGAHVKEQNPEGGVMRGGAGHGVHTSSRGVPGAKKHDAVVGVQNSKGSHAKKSEVVETDETEQVEQPAVKKSMVTIRGTEHVQYVDDGTDAAIAKSILEGSLGGTAANGQGTQPLDLNNDLTRLLI